MTDQNLDNGVPPASTDSLLSSADVESLLDESETADTEGDRARAALLLDVLTPIVKTWPSVWGLKANDHAIQVLGGGRLRPRPCRRAALPRQSTQPDPRRHTQHPGQGSPRPQGRQGRGEGLKIFVEEMRSTLAEATAGPSWNAESAALAEVIDLVETVTAAVWKSGEPVHALENAWTCLEAVGHTVIAWL